MADTTVDGDREKLYLEVETAVCLRVDFQPSRQAWKYAHPQHEGELPRRPLVRFDISTKTIHTYPLKTGPSLSIMGPKFGPVIEIAFEGLTFTLPISEQEVEKQLYQLGDHFYPQPIFGLGIRRHLRPIIEVIGRNGFRRLVISRTKVTTLAKPTLVLSDNDFEEVASELDRIAARFTDQSRTERSRHAYNEILAGHFPDEFRRHERPYRKGVLFSLLRTTKGATNSMSTADREALIERAAERSSRAGETQSPTALQTPATSRLRASMR